MMSEELQKLEDERTDALKELAFEFAKKKNSLKKAEFKEVVYEVGNTLGVMTIPPVETWSEKKGDWDWNWEENEDLPFSLKVRLKYAEEFLNIGKKKDKYALSIPGEELKYYITVEQAVASALLYCIDSYSKG